MENETAPVGSAQDTATIAADPVDFGALWSSARAWAENAAEQLFSMASVWQLVAIIAAGLLGWFLSRRPGRKLQNMAARPDTSNTLTRLLSICPGRNMACFRRYFDLDCHSNFCRSGHA